MVYNEFSNKAIKDFQSVQNNFLETYKINDYSDWYYNDSTELLTLSTGENQINFKYIPIGTYSKKTETWMWTWNKLDSIEKWKKETLKIKEFGQSNQYSKLVDGHFDSDEYDGWEFTAISHKLLDSIGGYRVVSEHLEIYMLVKEKVENQVAEKIKEQIVNCHEHGANRTAFVCQHLVGSANRGFEEAFTTFKGMELEEDDDFQAWCNECEIERLRTDGWNDDSMKFAKIKLICEECYFEIKSKNLTE